jgi:hypothetical protein
MSRHIASMIAVTVVLGGSLADARERAALLSLHSTIPRPGGVELQAAATGPTQLIIGGQVRRVLGSGAFVLEDPRADAGELLVLAPDAESTPIPGAAVIARGLFRRFEQPELDRLRTWTEIDPATREPFAARPILLANSLTTAAGRSLMRHPVLPLRPPAQRSPIVSARQPEPINLRPGGLAQLIDEVGGRPVTLLRARVIAVINPQVLLIESASPLQATIGMLDRVLVLIDDAELRVDAGSLRGADVHVAGTARTLLGAQVSGEIAWPRELTPDTVKRLEIRAAVLATSVRTADGVELTRRLERPD